MFIVGMECRRVACGIEGIGAMEVCGAQGDGGGVLDADVQGGRSGKDTV
jgi:hypothetical protein